jgi:hypothetical protein
LVALKRFYKEYPNKADPPIQLDTWIMAIADDGFAEPHLDNNKPINEGQKLRHSIRKK